MDAKRLLFLMLIFISVLSVAHSFGIGVSPATIRMSDVLVGTEVPINLSISNPNDFTIVGAYQRGGEIGNWIETESGFTIGPNSNMIVTIKLNIPENAQDKSYQGMLVMAANPVSTSEGTGSAISAAVGVLFYVDVTSERFARVIIISQEVFSTLQNYPIETIINLKNTGNAEANLSYKFEIKDAATKTKLFYESSRDGPTIYPGQELSEHIILDIPSLPAGKYVLITYVYANGELVGTIEKEFTIHATGTVLARGNLLRLIHENKTLVNTPTSIQGLFYNVGDLDLFAKMRLSVYKDTGELVDVLDSDFADVKANQTKLLEVNYKFTETGTYVLKAKAIYSGTSSDEIQSLMEVYDKGIELPSGDIMFMMILIAGILVILLIIVLALRRKKKKTKEEKPKKRNRGKKR